MRTARAVYTLLFSAALALVVVACRMDLSVPQYSLEFRGITAYPTEDSEAFVEYRYSAEEDVHRCRYLLTDSRGRELDSGSLLVQAGVWQPYRKVLAEEDRYRLQVVVQVQKPSGEFVDLACLDRSLDLFVDTSSPDEPRFTLPAGVYTTDQHAELFYEEASGSPGSPVELYYRLNGSPLPRDGGERYQGLPVLVSVAPTAQELNAVVIDAAGNLGPIETMRYQFMGITAVVNTMPTGRDPPDTAELGGLWPFEVSGFGLVAEATEVAVFDRGGNFIPIFGLPAVSPERISFALDLRGAAIVPGVGRIDVRLTEPETDWVSIPFTVLAP